MKRRLLFSLVIGFICLLGTNNQKIVKAEVQTYVEYTFDGGNYDGLQAFYSETTQSSYGEQKAFTDAFSQEDGYIKSIRQGSGTGSTEDIVYLTVTNYQFTNFEMIIKGGFSNPNPSWGWIGMAYRQTIPGAGFMVNGGFAGMMQECKALVWGAPEMGGGKYESTLLEECETPTNKENVTLKLRVVNNKITLEVINASNDVASRQVVERDDVVTRSGYVSFVSVDNTHKLSYLKVTALDSNGNATALTPVDNSMDDIVIQNKVTSLQIGETRFLEYNIEKEKQDKIVLSSSNNDVVIASGNTISAIGEGTATIIASNYLDGLNNDTFTINVSGKAINTGKKVINFSSLDVLDNYTVNYVKDQKTDGYDVTKPSTYFKYDSSLDAIVRINDTDILDQSNDMTSIFIDGTYTNFELSLIYKNTELNPGWIGVFAGHSDKALRFMDSGYGVFLQKEGYATIWGRDVPIHEQKNVSYKQSAWHIMQVRVFNGKVSTYVDDLSNPIDEVEVGKTSLGSGQIGIFTTGGGFAIRQMAIGYMDGNGNPIDYYPVTSFDVKNVNSNVKVGDSITLEATFNENATNKNLVLESSNSNICIAKNGTLNFINEGNVNIDIYSDDDKSFKKQMSFVVSSDSSVNNKAEVPEGYGERKTNYNPNVVENEVVNEVEIISIINIALVVVNTIGLIIIALLFIKRRKKA